MSQDTYTLPELAEASGVSARTIRYYISQGVLQGAVKAGENSHYLPTHLKRLRVIQANKKAGQSLEQIKQHLGLVPSSDPTDFLLIRQRVAPDIEVNYRAFMTEGRRKKVEAAIKAFTKAVSETTDDKQE